MESNHGNLCCQCVSGWYLEKCLPLLELLMVYDHIKCLGEWASPSFPVTHFVTQPTPPSLSNTNTYTCKHSLTQSGVQAIQLTLCLWRQLPVLMKRPIIQVRSSLVSPVDGELKLIVVKVRKSLFASLFFFPAPFLPLFHYPPPCPETNISKHPALCCTHARSHSSGLWVIEGVLRWEHGEGVSHHLLFLFSFVSHKLRIFC